MPSSLAISALGSPVRTAAQLFEPIRAERPDASPVDATLLRKGDPLTLPLSDERTLELGPCSHDRQHEGRYGRVLASEGQVLGLDTSDYSFGYVATWAGGGDQAIAGTKGSCDRIQKAASAILRPFEAGEQEEAA
jgi:hypothetical protein